MSTTTNAPPQPSPILDNKPAPPPVTRGRGRAFTIFFLFLLIAAGVGLYFWLQSRDFESTDDAEVEAHLNSISSRVDGAITHVYVDDNQFVKAGDPLVDLDPRDFQVTVDQARAQVAQAHSQVTAQQPNIPITVIENSTNITGAEADVATAEAAVGVSERDRETAAARLAEAQANAAKAHSDLARYTVLIKNEEVSQQEFDQISATAKAQDAAVDANRAAVESAARTVVERQSQAGASEIPSGADPTQRALAGGHPPGQCPIAASQPTDRASHVGAGAIETQLYENRGSGRRYHTEAIRRSGRTHQRGPAVADDRPDWRHLGDGRFQRDADAQHPSGAIGPHSRGRPASEL